MKVNERPCDRCQTSTELMYKVYDSANVSRDIPICVPCLIHVVKNLIKRAMFQKFTNLSNDKKFSDLMNVDEGIAVFMEYVDIKIQNIGTQYSAEPNAPKVNYIALIIRSIYNNQYRVRVYPDDTTLGEVYRHISEELLSIFKDSRYPEDMV